MPRSNPVTPATTLNQHSNCWCCLSVAILVRPFHFCQFKDCVLWPNLGQIKHLEELFFLMLGRSSHCGSEVFLVCSFDSFSCAISAFGTMSNPGTECFFTLPLNTTCVALGNRSLHI